jgi:hypothetical protein
LEDFQSNDSWYIHKKAGQSSIRVEKQIKDSRFPQIIEIFAECEPRSGARTIVNVGPNHWIVHALSETHSLVN